MDLKRPLKPSSLVAAFLLGGIFALSMPSPRLTPLAPFALYFLYQEAQGACRARWGFLFGLGFFLLSLSWVTFPVHVYGKVPALLAPFPLLLLAGYCSLFFALPLWVLGKLRPFLSPAHWSYPLLFSLLVSGGEEARGLLFTGFPWNPIALSLTGFPLLLKPAQVVGVTGLGFLLLLLTSSLGHLLHNPRKATLPLPLLTLILWVLFSLPSPHSQPLTLRYGIIQGSIPQDVKWTREYQHLTLQIYEDLSRQAQAREGKLDLVVWPETAAPFYFQEPGPLRLWMVKIAQELNAPLLFGAPAYELGSPPLEYNRAYLLGKGGEILGYYDKIHLVPFGEYVPLKELLFFVHRLAEGIGEFARGNSRYPLEAPPFKPGILICYEAIFPYEVREFVVRGANLLVQITNDAWFGPTWAPEQHLELARLRAVELGVPLLRAANTGVSAVITPEGAIVERTRIFERTYLAGSLTFAERRTPFRRLGWLYPWLFLSGFFLPLGFVLFQRFLPQKGG